MSLDIESRNGGVRFAVRVSPRSSRSAIEGIHAAALKVRLSAPPVDGAANEALIVLLAHALGVPRRDVAIVRGLTSRNKVVDITGVTAEDVRRLTGT
jgi:uncharacterized protein (TIGR00251 family)